MALKKMQDLKSTIYDLENTIRECDNYKKSVKLKHELSYQKNLFSNIVDRYWDRGFTELEMKQSKGRQYKADYLTQNVITGVSKIGKERANRNSNNVSVKD